MSNTRLPIVVVVATVAVVVAVIVVVVVVVVVALVITLYPKPCSKYSGPYISFCGSVFFAGVVSNC